MSEIKANTLKDLSNADHIVVGTPILVRSAIIANTVNTMIANHGQASTPDLFWGEMTFIVATGGYLVGDVIKIQKLYEEDENDHALTVWATSTQMGFSQTGTDEVLRANNKTSGALISIGSTATEIRMVGVWF